MIGSLWFAAGVAAWLFTGRMPFLLGVAIGLGALLAADSRRLPLSGVLAALSALGSPVAGLFTAIAGAALALTGDRARGLTLALPPLAAIAILTLAFPTGGEEPFVFTAFVGIPLAGAGDAVVRPARAARASRRGDRLRAARGPRLRASQPARRQHHAPRGALRRAGAGAGHLAAAGARCRPRAAAAVLAAQRPGARHDRRASAIPPPRRPSTQPLLGQLDRQADDRSPTRVHVPPTQNRWEAVYVAERFPLARGWLRQLESDDFELFADHRLTAAGYRDWLDQHGVSHVAVPQQVDRDYLAEDEVELIERGTAVSGPGVGER